MFGDKDLKRLKRELEDGKIAMQLGPKLGANLMSVGIQNTRRDLSAAVHKLQGSGRGEEAKSLLKGSRISNPEGGEEAWNEILDGVLKEISE